LLVLPPLHGQGSKLQAGDPALGARIQGYHVCRRQVEAHHPVEESGRFFRSKAQFGSADLGHPAPHAQPRDGQRWVGAPGDH
jgi:hypothetical protein